MKHQIDPKIDCVFKALLGSEENRNLLQHFLNAVLGSELATPISAVEILNPYNEREFLEDRLSIVDVKAWSAMRIYPNVLFITGRIFTVSNYKVVITFCS